MKQLLTILAFFLSAHLWAGQGHIFTYTQDQILAIDGAVQTQIQPGDTIYLKKANAGVISLDQLAFFNLHGTITDSIYIRVWPGERLIIDGTEVATNGALWSFNNCSYFSFIGPTGSNRTEVKSSQHPTERYRVFGIQFWNKCHSFTFHNARVVYGGTGMQLKTEIEQDSTTWYGRTYLGPVDIQYVQIDSTTNEAFYMNSTAWYRNLQSGYVEQIDTWNEALPDTVQSSPTDFDVYKRPLILQKLTFKNNTVNAAGNDAFQFASVDSLIMQYCIANNWNTSNQNHLYGILVGSRIKYSRVEDCILWNSPLGHGYANFGENNEHQVRNVLIYNISDNFITIKGGEHLVNNSNHLVTFENLTMAKNGFAGGVGARINGIMGGTASHIFRNSVIAEPGDGGFGGGSSNPRYFYVENGGAYTESAAPNDNRKFSLLSEANLDANNYLLPLNGSTVTDEGFRMWSEPEPPAPPPAGYPRNRTFIYRKQ